MHHISKSTISRDTAVEAYTRAICDATDGPATSSEHGRLTDLTERRYVNM